MIRCKTSNDDLKYKRDLNPKKVDSFIHTHLVTHWALFYAPKYSYSLFHIFSFSVYTIHLKFQAELNGETNFKETVYLLVLVGG